MPNVSPGTEPLKILHFLSTSGVGGTETAVFKLVRYGDSARLLQSVAALPSPGAMTKRFEEIGTRMKHFFWDQRRDRMGAVLEIRRFIIAGGYDLVIAYGLRPNIILRLIGLGTGVPMAGGLRFIFSSTRESALYDRLDWVTFPLSRGYISNSQMAIDRYVSLGMPRNKFLLCYNGIDTEWFSLDRWDRSAGRGEFGVGPDDVLLINVARLEKVKNQEMIIRVLKILREKGFRAFLVFVGEGARRTELEKTASELGLAAYIHFTGLRQDVPQLLTAADVFLLSSQWEGIPNAVLEAMAMGLPVVSTELPGVREVMDESVEGFFVPQNDSDAMAECAARLICDTEMRRAMGRHARDRIVRQFSMDSMVRSFDSCCRELVHANT